MKSFIKNRLLFGLLKEGSVYGPSVVDFVKALEQSGIIKDGSHQLEDVIKTVKQIVSMTDKEFNDYITNNPNNSVVMIYKEFKDWVQSYKPQEEISEVYFLTHSTDRIKERLNVFSDTDIPKYIKDELIKNVNLLRNYDFPKNKSFGVMIGKFNPNPESMYYKEVAKGRGYYSINDDKIIHDSTGDQFWVIIRDNKVTTFMLRKAIQTKDVEHNKEKLMVDVVIKDLEKYIKEKSSGPPPKKDTYKKIKLPSGKIVRYYELSNRFETDTGTPLKLDDIFDSLPEKLQDFVINKMD